jgi:hypothetical protein
LPYNVHTTASDALWAGLPVLTQIGENFASRVAASLLAAIRLSELIVQTMEQFERLAIELRPQRTSFQLSASDWQGTVRPRRCSARSCSRAISKVPTPPWSGARQGLWPELIKVTPLR